jgi:hypothetical protein
MDNRSAQAGNNILISIYPANRRIKEKTGMRKYFRESSVHGKHGSKIESNRYQIPTKAPIRII